MVDDNNDHHDVVLDRETFESNDLRFPQGTDNTRLLVTMNGRDARDNYTKADVKNSRCPLAIAFTLHRDRIHNNQDGVRLCEDILAITTAISGERAKLFSDTIIGERRISGMRRGLGDWIRDKAGMGGDKE